MKPVSVGMAMAAGIVMRCWGNETYAREILKAAGLTHLRDLRSAGVEQYDIDALTPVLASLVPEEAGQEVGDRE